MERNVSELMQLHLVQLHLVHLWQRVSREDLPGYTMKRPLFTHVSYVVSMIMVLPAH